MGLANWTVFSISLQLRFPFEKRGCGFYSSASALTSSLGHYGNRSEVQQNSYRTFHRTLRGGQTTLKIDLTHWHFCKAGHVYFMHKHMDTHRQASVHSLTLLPSHGRACVPNIICQIDKSITRRPLSVIIFKKLYQDMEVSLVTETSSLYYKLF